MLPDTLFYLGALFSQRSGFAVIMLFLTAGVILVHLRYIRPHQPKDPRELLYTLISTGVLLIFFSPLFTSRYVFWDDYYIWFSNRTEFNTHPQYNFIYGLGRPLANIFLFPLFSLVEQLSSANIVRLVAVLSTISVFWLTKTLLRSLKFSQLQSHLLGLAIVTGMPFLVYNYWLNATYIPLGIVLSILSFFLARRLISTIKESEFDTTGTPGGLIRLRIIQDPKVWQLWGLSTAFSILSLASYQPAAGYFACFAGIYLLSRKFSDSTSFTNTLSVLGSIFFTSNLIYFISLRVAFYLFSFEDFSADYDPRGLSYLFDPAFLIHKMNWFVRVPLFNSFNFLNGESMFASVTILMVVVTGIAFLYCREVHLNGITKQQKRSIRFKYLIILACLPASYVSVLISDNSNPNFRTIAPMMAFSLLASAIAIRSAAKILVPRARNSWSLWSLSNALSLLLIAACLFNLTNGYAFLKHFTASHSAEIDYLRKEIGSTHPGKIRQITVILPDKKPSIRNPLSELNAYSASHIPPDFLNPMLICAFSEDGSNHHLPCIKVVAKHHGEKWLIREAIAPPLENIHLVREDYKGFNIIRTHEIYFAILRGEGAFGQDRIQNNEYSIFFVAILEDDVLSQIDVYRQSEESEKKSFLDRSVREYHRVRKMAPLTNEPRTENLIIDMRKLDPGSGYFSK